MEYTCQNPMRFPAAYAVVAEEEMVYVEGGAFTFNVGKYQVTVNIDQQQVLAFCTNVVVNYIRLLGQAAFTNAVNGLQAARADGLSTKGAVQYFWKNQGTFGRVATVVAGGFAGYYLYVQAVNIYYAAVSLYNDLKTAYEQSMTPQLIPTPAGAA